MRCVAAEVRNSKILSNNLLTASGCYLVMCLFIHLPSCWSLKVPVTLLYFGVCASTYRGCIRQETDKSQDAAAVLPGF